MAKCGYCLQEMMNKVSCQAIPVETSERKKYDPIPYGKETRYPLPEGVSHCPDCSTPVGGYHHPGCDAEECPACHGQALGCDCLSETAQLGATNKE